MTQLNITLTASGNPVITIPIPAALQTLDASPSGFSAVDQLTRAIFRAGVFTDGAGNWYPAAQIASITAQ
jgi:hypothetical protein